MKNTCVEVQDQVYGLVVAISSIDTTIVISSAPVIVHWSFFVDGCLTFGIIGVETRIGMT